MKDRSSDDPGAQILVSACLAGRACAYDGNHRARDRVLELLREGRAVLVCPEAEGGLGIPRPPAETVGGDGNDVLSGRARVLTDAGDDVTPQYLAGARIAVERARAAGCRLAILKARSPSCGCGAVFDGTFSRTLREGDGVTAAALLREGIEVITDEDL
ncbi:DUF523 domain-containing protein [Polyangium sp. 15x6]|uniref:DUF523 domain-containing protein n=1 Tax=Polyangium sp. 15x6 TaxID=3042687 RepID=UPI00249AE703|nr:DUF523 domain-containing protein [Polyangium sp. 15x6]MDI3284499.1 DUF523 domain-containing protein [Polyangium sp. 15x6]